VEFDGHGFGAEVAASVLVEVQKVFSPDLDVSVSILGTVVRVDSVDTGWLIVSEWLTVVRVSKVTSDRDL